MLKPIVLAHLLVCGALDLFGNNGKHLIMSHEMVNTDHYDSDDQENVSSLSLDDSDQGFHFGTVNFSPQIGIFYYYGSTESPAGNPSQAPTPVREPEAVSLAPETSQVKLVYRSAIPMDGQMNKVAAILTKEALDSSVTSWDCHICDGLKKQFGVPFECVFESQFSALIGKCRRKCSIFELKKRGSIFFLMVKIGSVQT